jgi:hypothetical protein
MARMDIRYCFRLVNQGIPGQDRISRILWHWIDEVHRFLEEIDLVLVGLDYGFELCLLFLKDHLVLQVKHHFRLIIRMSFTIFDGDEMVLE